MFSYLSSIPVVYRFIAMLCASNLFMIYAWYAHLKNLSNRPWYLVVVICWSIAFFEYLIQVPANRLGATELSLGQLKIIQEIVTLSVFVPFAYFYMKQPLRLDYLWAALCLCGAAYFIFRGHDAAAATSLLKG